MSTDNQQGDAGKKQLKAFDDRPDIAFTVWYKKFHRPQEGQILGKDINSAREKFVKYCGAHKMTFISIFPFFMDLDKPPAPERMPQKDPQDEQRTLDELSVLQQKNFTSAVRAARSSQGSTAPEAEQPSEAEVAEASRTIE